MLLINAGCAKIAFAARFARHLLQDFQIIFDHFGTLYIKVIKMTMTVLMKS